MINITEHRLPSHWAPALINCDESGMEDQEIELMNSVLEYLGVNSSSCLDVLDDEGGSFELPPSYIHSSYGLLAGAYSTFSFSF